ncbi:MAG: GntR family transcriptional regulator [Desulfobacteraceae bacterium]|nr:MAG: GntR family transcriptional regulator [Desulfobacteraceae bacterium]
MVVRKGLTTEEVYQKIKEMIYCNQLAPGQKLIYNDLAKRLGVSMTPVVQALNRMENSSLVKYMPNKGYFVGEITESEVEQLFHAREALEIYIVPSVIANLNATSLDEIQQAFSTHREAYDSRHNRGLILLDAKFHLKIAAFARNQVIYKMLKDIYEQLYLKYPQQYISDDRAKQVVAEHRIILKALRKKDVAEAVEAIREHVKGGMSHVIRGLKPYTPFDL